MSSRISFGHHGLASEAALQDLIELRADETFPGAACCQLIELPSITRLARRSLPESRRWSEVWLPSRRWAGDRSRAFYSCVFVSIRGWVRRAFDINTNSGYGQRCSSGHGNFQWVFLKVWLSRLISGF